MNVFGLMIPDAVIDVAVLVLILLGAVLCLSAAVGLLHFRDVPSRLHAATKPQVLGLLLICIAIALSQRSIGGILLGFVLVARSCSCSSRPPRSRRTWSGGRPTAPAPSNSGASSWTSSPSRSRPRPPQADPRPPSQRRAVNSWIRRAAGSESLMSVP